MLQFAGLQSSARVLGPTGEEDRKTHGGQQEAADEGKTVKGGNPACQKRGDDGGGFVQMRERIRQGRLDASEDARDWMRDKRDDMNTMKEVREHSSTEVEVGYSSTNLAAGVKVASQRRRRLDTAHYCLRHPMS